MLQYSYVSDLQAAAASSPAGSQPNTHQIKKVQFIIIINSQDVKQCFLPDSFFVCISFLGTCFW